MKLFGLKRDIPKMLVMLLGEILITAGIRLQNIYQPPVEDTLNEYLAVLRFPKSNGETDRE